MEHDDKTDSGPLAPTAQGTAALLVDAGALLGEGARWDRRRGELIWVDIDGGIVHRFDPATGRDRMAFVKPPVGLALPFGERDYLVALPDGFWRLTVDGALKRFRGVDLAPGMQFNDGACDPAGRLWIGTLAADETPHAGTLYRLDPDGTLSEHVHGLTISNGVALSLDATTLYFVDSATQCVDAFEYDIVHGTLGHRRTIARIPVAMGVPDGMCVDAEGCLWVALWGGGAVVRLTPHGALTHRIDVPTPYVTACALGGQDGRTLFITSASAYFPDDFRGSRAGAGGLFSAQVAVPGPPSIPFGGSHAGHRT